MKQAMMWWDDSPKKSLAQKVAEASAYHLRKYGAVPNLCFVPIGAVGEPLDVDGVTVRPLR